MDFITARDLIRDVLENSFNKAKKNFIIDQILWDVARNDSPEMANALVRHFHLYMYDNGSHMWFDGDDRPEHDPVVGPIYVKIEREFNSKPGKKISSKGIA